MTHSHRTYECSTGIEFLFFLAPLISGVVMFVTIYLAVWAALATHDRRKARRLRQMPSPDGGIRHHCTCCGPA
ncbi:hypothetical protein HS048_04730 [Planomonospora sp. ID91781]|uniref:hypothetical protein n=1 Tax=Planomonospora sp. ID91781 TaxID=2738135 RepID=UPI0018C371D5|nr:hypothetical protein [Planomonospora sp. ID91781]MBG0820043.1 hypothetical protein [Planomonospora sp. ID91781]